MKSNVIEEIEKNVFLTHPLIVKKITHSIIYAIFIVFLTLCVIVSFNMDAASDLERSANIGAGIFFLIIALLLLVLMILNILAPVSIKKVNGELVGVRFGIRKNIVFVGIKQVYKGKEKKYKVITKNSTFSVYFEKNSFKIN